MNSRTIATDVVVTITLWALVAVFFTAAWVLHLTHHHEVAVMVALTGCPVVALAMVGQIRCYTRRVCGLVRATSFESRDAPVHSLR